MGKTLNLITAFSGKVGSVIGAVRKNSMYPQILRQYQPSVTNPQTLKQQRQRYLFATVVQAMSSMYDIVNHSFENVRYGQDSLNYFQKENLLALRSNEHLNYLFKGNTALVPNEYLISKGSLEEMKVDWDNEGLLVRIVADDGAQGVTCGSFLEAFPDFKAGDQLTVCYIIDTNETAVTVGNIQQKLYRFRYDRCVTSVLMADNLEGNFLGPNGFNTEMIDQALTTDTGFLRVGETGRIYIPGHNSEGSPSWLARGEQIVGGCLIHSQKDSRGNWMRSTSRISFNDSLWGYYDLDSAIESYNPVEVTEDIVDYRYLNNARSATGLKETYLQRPVSEVEAFYQIGDAAMVKLVAGQSHIITAAPGTRIKYYFSGIPTGYSVVMGTPEMVIATAGTTKPFTTIMATGETTRTFKLKDADGNSVIAWPTTLRPTEEPVNP